MSSHNSFLCLINFFKIKSNNLISTNVENIVLLETPYTQIIVNPTFVQFLNNWNKVDTVFAFTTLFFGTLIAYPSNKKDYNTHNFQKTKNFEICITVTIFVALTLELLNS